MAKMFLTDFIYEAPRSRYFILSLHILLLTCSTGVANALNLYYEFDTTNAQFQIENRVTTSNSEVNYLERERPLSSDRVFLHIDTTAKDVIVFGTSSLPGVLSPGYPTRISGSDGQKLFDSFFGTPIEFKLRIFQYADFANDYARGSTSRLDDVLLDFDELEINPASLFSPGIINTSSPVYGWTRETTGAAVAVGFPGLGADISQLSPNFYETAFSSSYSLTEANSFFLGQRAGFSPILIMNSLTAASSNRFDIVNLGTLSYIGTSFSATQVPEPTSILLLGAGMLFARRKFFSKTTQRQKRSESFLVATS